MQQSYHTNNLFTFIIIYSTIICCFVLLGAVVYTQDTNTPVLQVTKFEKEYDQCVMALVIKAIDEIEKGNTPSDYELSFDLINRIYELKNEREK